ncbi:hypothetical protein D3C78_760080 [compost metagenome]
MLQLGGVGECVVAPFVRDAWPEVLAIEFRLGGCRHDHPAMPARSFQFSHCFESVARQDGPQPDTAHEPVTQSFMIESLIAIGQLMEVQHDEFVRVSIKEQQYRVDQIVQDAMRAIAVVVKIET